MIRHILVERVEVYKIVCIVIWKDFYGKHISRHTLEIINSLGILSLVLIIMNGNVPENLLYVFERKD